jgi:hypothetical protein
MLGKRQKSICGSKSLLRGWILPAEYYDNVLYPLQNRVLPAFQDSHFYLTGGTALSRGYFNHRFSDDLDYFVNYHEAFQRLVQIQIDRIRQIFPSGVDIDYQAESFCRIFVGQEKLKIEMINDVPSHIGNIVDHPVLGRIDSKENILANKVTAVVDRFLPKDIVDIYFLLGDGLDIKRALLDADSKAAGISPLLVAKVLTEFDYQLLDSEIRWVTPISHVLIKDYLQAISRSIVEGTL